MGVTKNGTIKFVYAMKKMNQNPPLNPANILIILLKRRNMIKIPVKIILILPKNVIINILNSTIKQMLFSLKVHAKFQLILEVVHVTITANVSKNSVQLLKIMSKIAVLLMKDTLGSLPKIMDVTKNGIIKYVSVMNLSHWNLQNPLSPLSHLNLK